MVSHWALVRATLRRMGGKGCKRVNPRGCHASATVVGLVDLWQVCFGTSGAWEIALGKSGLVGVPRRCSRPLCPYVGEEC